MNLKQLFLALSLGVLAANSLPHGNPNSLDLQEEWSENGALHPSIQERALPSAAPITKSIGDDCEKREGLYVPFEYAGWMDAQSGQWERYQCDATEKGDKCDVKKGSTNDHIPKRILTDGLTSCVAIHIISKKGTIMTHIPPYVCQIINGDKNVVDKDGTNKQQADNIKKAARQLKKDHLKDMGETTVVAISGPLAEKNFMEHQQRAMKVVQELFDLRINKWEHLDNSLMAFDGWHSTTVDMTVSPPVFYKENTRMPINVP